MDSWLLITVLYLRKRQKKWSVCVKLCFVCFILAEILAMHMLNKNSFCLFMYCFIYFSSIYVFLSRFFAPSLKAGFNNPTKQNKKQLKLKTLQYNVLIVLWKGRGKKKKLVKTAMWIFQLPVVQKSVNALENSQSTRAWFIICIQSLLSLMNCAVMVLDNLPCL